ATIFALLPMAFGLTGNTGFIAQPLAVVVIGGLITSTLLTLVIVPVLYRLAEGPGERRRLREEEAERQKRARLDEEKARREAEAQRDQVRAGRETQAGATGGRTDGPGRVRSWLRRIRPGRRRG
ncbi:MAG: efflux RND transporter permease subunit, partial [Brachybacterium sp.]|nr:efflux RND transporter permease subunit [Brachybacterium sp.]